MLVLPTFGAPRTTTRWQFLGFARPNSSRSTDRLGNRSVDVDDLSAVFSCCLQFVLTVLTTPMPVLDMLETTALCAPGCVIGDCPVREFNILKMPSTGRLNCCVHLLFTSVSRHRAATNYLVTQSLHVCTKTEANGSFYRLAQSERLCVTALSRRRSPFIEA